MKVAYTISGIGHAAVLIWGVWSLAAKPLPVAPMLAVDIVSVSDFTQMTAGKQDAPKVETAKPLTEKVADAKPVEDVTAKVVEKKEVKAAREPPPAPEAKPVETKPAESKPVESKPVETKPAESKLAESKPEKKQAEVKPDPIAEALAKEEAKKPEPKKAEIKPPAPPKKPAPPAPKFDPKEIQAKLLNKQEATRLAAAGPDLNSVPAAPSAGLPTGQAKQLSQSELDALRQKLQKLWRIPPGARDPEELVVVFRIKLKPDGRLVEGPWPQLVSSGKTPLALAARESAARAINIGQPFDMLRPENYELWKDIEITFDPRDMIGGY
jgi:outer membrane biosynthesis protein TonB